MVVNDSRSKWIIVGLIILIPILIVVAMKVGYSKLSFSEIVTILMGGGQAKYRMILINFRLPRILIALLVGAGFAVSGAILQGITKNPLADPGIMGINAGGGLIVVLFIVGLGNLNFHSIFMMPFFSFVGAIVSVMIIYRLSSKGFSGLNPNKLILNGIAFNAGTNGLMMLIILKMDQTQHEFLARWQAGSIWGAHWQLVVALLPWIVAGIGGTLLLSGSMDVLSLGDSPAIALGLNIKSTKRKLLLLASGLAAASVSISGSIGFVGLMAPHISRKLVGNKHRYLIVASALVGACLVLIADIIARKIAEPLELPTGVVVSAIGAPYFIYLLFRDGKKTKTFKTT